MRHNNALERTKFIDTYVDMFDKLQNYKQCYWVHLERVVISRACFQNDSDILPDKEMFL